MQNLDGTGNPNGVYYVSWAQAPTRRVTFVWRGSPTTVDAVRREFTRNVPGAALFDIRSMTERQELTLAMRRTAHALALVFAVAAVLLAAVGVHGLLAFFVEQRRREIGIRMAVGCEPSGIFSMFVRDGLVLAALGLAAGATLSMALRNWIAGHLYGVGAMDPAVAALSVALIVAVAGVSTAAPAWRAARLVPVRVLGE
jgi:ABC-type antimicrobial peptide transport system permease subunit